MTDVKKIGDRLAEDTRTLMAEGINVLAIMPNDYKAYPEDSPEKMKQFASQHGFDFPYLIDEDQSVGKQYDAVCTADFFGLNREGRLQYRGRLDNARMDDPSDRVPELLNAMRTIAATDKGPEDQQPGMGCSIKWREN
ncbi:thioredoxin family protein [Endozoicomonas gorgoniicola]|uniref:Thioredoxin family protein n=1 Tax=Endozoicomonas gorgoniicola TaxID=1234144 RepID=A0ABT3N1S7_9GAMM|nr:thioredoxin family protein [Endozoicomonas gorgoniicola]MCW7555590.1 thioredoxin family protein [Endozoicomonas gorgoniicola]